MPPCTYFSSSHELPLSLWFLACIRSTLSRSMSNLVRGHRVHSSLFEPMNKISSHSTCKNKKVATVVRCLECLVLPCQSLHRDKLDSSWTSAVVWSLFILVLTQTTVPDPAHVLHNSLGHFMSPAFGSVPLLHHMRVQLSQFNSPKSACLLVSSRVVARLNLPVCFNGQWQHKSTLLRSHVLYIGCSELRT